MRSTRCTVIAGCMYAGKTEELLRRVERARIAKVPVQAIVPSIDTRFGVGVVRSHGARELGQEIPVWVASGAERDFLPYIGDATKLVAIDEAQFFGPELVSAVVTLLRRNISVVAAGLDLDFRGLPFGPMPQLLALADEVVKVRAICMCCGDDATRTFRRSGERATVLVGASETYEARCFRCWSLQAPDDAAVRPETASV
jgi:thymidine kinase